MIPGSRGHTSWDRGKPPYGGRIHLPRTRLEMTMDFIDARMRVSHPCPFCDLSKQFPEAEMYLWCNRKSEVLHVSAEDDTVLEDILRAAKNALNVREVIKCGKQALTMTYACVCNVEGSVTHLADKNECWLIPPTLYTGGWETHRVVSPSKKALQRFVTDIRRSGEVEIVSLRERNHLSAISDLAIAPVHFFEGLTARQINCLVMAFENGLFDVPARTHMDKVARAAEMSRSTYGEHLRKAQLQILRNSYPILKLRSMGVSGAGSDQAAAK